MVHWSWSEPTEGSYMKAIHCEIQTVCRLRKMGNRVTEGTARGHGEGNRGAGNRGFLVLQQCEWT